MKSATDYVLEDLAKEYPALDVETWPDKKMIPFLKWLIMAAYTIGLRKGQKDTFSRVEELIKEKLP